MTISRPQDILGPVSVIPISSAQHWKGNDFLVTLEAEPGVRAGTFPWGPWERWKISLVFVWVYSALFPGGGLWCESKQQKAYYSLRCEPGEGQAAGAKAMVSSGSREHGAHQGPREEAGFSPQSTSRLHILAKTYFIALLSHLETVWTKDSKTWNQMWFQISVLLALRPTQ